MQETKKLDISNIFFCFYKDENGKEKVGLGKEFITELGSKIYFSASGAGFIGIVSQNDNRFVIGSSIVIDNKAYIINQKLEKVVPYYEMKMYKEKCLASTSEISELLSYAATTYREDSKSDKQKVKNNLR